MLTRILVHCGLLGSFEALAFEPTAHYQQTNIAGFKVLVSATFDFHVADRDAALQEIARQGSAIGQAVDPSILPFLQSVPIWLEWQKKTNGAAEYHPSLQWLRANGYNPAKAKGIEINNARNFVRWSHADQPSMLLHELAHAFHDQVLGWDDSTVHAAYQKARASRRYETVLHVNGRKTRAYALTNEKEYFAELSEAFFGRNDFYPFIRPELQQFDATAFSMLARKWKTSIPSPLGSPRADFEGNAASIPSPAE